MSRTRPPDDSRVDDQQHGQQHGQQRAGGRGRGQEHGPQHTGGRGRGRPPGRPVRPGVLRTLREERGWSQDELAGQAGINVRTIRRCESAKGPAGHRLSSDTIRRLADALEVDSEALVGSSEETVHQQLAQYFLQPPPPPDPWSGREIELAHIVARLSAGRPGLLCIAGPSGIGKTALALSAVARLSSGFPGGVIWLRAAHDGLPLDMDDACLRIAQGLGFLQRLPDSAGAAALRQTIFLGELWSGRRLLVLDDLLLDQTLRFFAPGAGQNATILATTHHKNVADLFAPEDVLVLDGLSQDDTRHILGSHVQDGRIERDPDGLRHLHQALCGVPRSIYIAGSILRRQRLVELSDYAERVDRDLTAGQYPRALQTADNSLVVSFEQIQRHVTEAAWTLLGPLSLFEDAPFDDQWAAAAGQHLIPGLSAAAVKEPLSELMDVYLVEQVPAAPQAYTQAHTQAHTQAPAAMRFRMAAHVPLYARNLLGENRLATLHSLAGHASSLAGKLVEAQDWPRIHGARALWASLLDALVYIIFERDALRGWEARHTWPTPAPGPARAALSELVSQLIPYLARDVLPHTGLWLAAALECGRELERPSEQARLSLALGRWWLRARVNMPRAIECFEAAMTHFVATGDHAAAATAASEAGRILFACERAVEGLDRFDRAIEYVRMAHDSGPPLACCINNAAVSFTRQPGPEGWRRAAELLDEACRACQGEEPASRFFRLVCTLNLASVRHALRAMGEAGQPSNDTSSNTSSNTSGNTSSNTIDQQTLDQLVADWHALDVDAPLFEARLHLLCAYLTRSDSLESAHLDQATALWHEQLRDTPLAREDLLWFIGESAFYLRLHLQSSGEHQAPESPVIAGGFALSDVSREIVLAGQDLVPIGFFFPVAPTRHFFTADDYLRQAKELADEVFGPNNRVSAELATVASLLGDDAGQGGAPPSD